METRLASNVETATNWRDYYELTKPRVVFLIVFTAVVGMFLSVPGWPPATALLFGTLGIGLASSSAAVFNHVLDARIDIQMMRTRGRPLPQPCRQRNEHSGRSRSNPPCCSACPIDCSLRR